MHYTAEVTVPYDCINAFSFLLSVHLLWHTLHVL